MNEQQRKEAIDEIGEESYTGEAGVLLATAGDVEMLLEQLKGVISPKYQDYINYIQRTGDEADAEKAVTQVAQGISDISRGISWLSDQVAREAKKGSGPPFGDTEGKLNRNQRKEALNKVGQELVAKQGATKMNEQQRKAELDKVGQGIPKITFDGVPVEVNDSGKEAGEGERWLHGFVGEDTEIYVQWRPISEETLKETYGRGSMNKGQRQEALSKVGEEDPGAKAKPRAVVLTKDMFVDIPDRPVPEVDTHPYNWIAKDDDREVTGEGVLTDLDEGLEYLQRAAESRWGANIVEVYDRKSGQRVE